MVYCGKPSKGCQTCRERKIRCDQIPEGCTQCAKVHRVCPGYRDQLDLIFRNESVSVVRKAKAKEKSKRRQSQPLLAVTPRRDVIVPVASSSLPSPATAAGQDLLQYLHHSCGGTSSSAFPSFLRPSYSFPTSLDERATGFFFQNYVIGINGSARHLYDYNSTMYRPSDSDPQLAASMKAVGLAGFSNIACAPELMKEARKSYMTALQLTNTALRSPVDAVKDSTLLAIMILSLYETVTGYNQRSLAAWAEHVNGAATLVKLRGHEQLETPAGLRMFIQVTSSLLISCIQRDLPMPAHVVELRKKAAQYVDSNDPAWRVQDNVIEFTYLRAGLKDGTLSDPETILAMSLNLDRVFIDIFEKLPKGWGYEVIRTDADPHIVFGGYYHVYRDYWVAQIYNAMRTCRILLNSSIRDELLKGFTSRPPRFLEPEHTLQYQASTDILFKLRADILATAPQHLGYTKNKGSPASTPSPDSSSSTGAPYAPSTPGVSEEPIRGRSITNLDALTPPPYIRKEGPTTAPIKEESLPMLRGSGGYFLLWPLYLVGVMDIASDEVREWVVQCLRTIGRSMGIQQAIALAGFLERQERMAAWEREQKIRDEKETKSLAASAARQVVYESMDDDDY